MTWITGVDCSFDPLTRDEARRLHESGVRAFAQCLWTGRVTPPPAVANLRTMAAYPDVALLGYISIAPGHLGAYHVDMGVAAVPRDIWPSLVRVPIDVELDGLTFADVQSALGRITTLGKPPDIYTNYRTWVDVLGNPTRPPGTGLWNAYWDANPDFDFPKLRFGGWQDDEVWGEQWSGGTYVGGQFVDRDAFRKEALVGGDMADLKELEDRVEKLEKQVKDLKNATDFLAKFPKATVEHEKRLNDGAKALAKK